MGCRLCKHVSPQDYHGTIPQDFPQTHKAIYIKTNDNLHHFKIYNGTHASFTEIRAKLKDTEYYEQSLYDHLCLSRRCFLIIHGLIQSSPCVYSVTLYNTRQEHELNDLSLNEILAHDFI